MLVFSGFKHVVDVLGWFCGWKGADRHMSAAFLNGGQSLSARFSPWYNSACFVLYSGCLSRGWCMFSSVVVSFYSVG